MARAQPDRWLAIVCRRIIERRKLEPDDDFDYYVHYMECTLPHFQKEKSQHSSAACFRSLAIFPTNATASFAPGSKAEEEKRPA
jgi:hypothetical protein